MRVLDQWLTNQWLKFTGHGATGPQLLILIIFTTTTVTATKKTV